MRRVGRNRVFTDENEKYLTKKTTNGITDIHCPNRTIRRKYVKYQICNRQLTDDVFTLK